MYVVWVILILILGLIIWLIIFLSRLVRKNRREAAKKAALQWLLNEKIPSSAQYNRVHDTLTKIRYDEEAADILKKIISLNQRGQ